MDIMLIAKTWLIFLAIDEFIATGVKAKEDSIGDAVMHLIFGLINLTIALSLP